MSLSHAPSIARNGLILFHDQGNLKKGFLGRPTTNQLAPYGNNFAAWSTNAVTVTPNATLSPDGLFNGSLLYVTATGGSRSVALAQGPSAGGSFAVNLKAGASNGCAIGVYTASAWAGGGSSGIISGPGSLSGSGSLWTISGLSVTDWTRLYVQSTLTGNCYIYPGGTGNTTGNSVYANEAQAEALAYPSPFNAGSRSVTQSMLDLTGINSLDVTNLGWDGTNQPIYSGASTYYINCGNAAALSFGTGNFHVAQWVKTSDTSAADWMCSLSKYSLGAGTGPWIQGSPTNRYAAFGWDGATYTSSTTSINNGVYRYVACQRTGPTTAEIYVDGILVASGAGANKSSDSAQQLDIGRIAVGGRYWNGEVPVTMAYNRSLSAAEINNNFNAMRGRFGV